MNLTLERLIIVILIFTIPYNNFPIIQGGTLKPLASVGIPILFLFLCKDVANKNTGLNRLDIRLLVLFFTIIVLSYSNSIFKNIPEAKHYTSVFRRQVEFTGFAVLSLYLYYLGNLCGRLFGLIEFGKLVASAFLLPLMVGMVQVITSNGALVNEIRDLFVTAKFRVNHNRIAMLTTEPSWAAFDLVGFLLPFLILIYTKNRFFSLVCLIASAVCLIGTRSTLGYLLLVIFVGVYILFSVRSRKKVVMYSVAGCVAFFLLLSLYGTSYPIERVSNISTAVRSNDLVEESASTRLLSYFVAWNIFEDNPLFGIGYRNELFFYGNYVPAEYLNYPIIKDYAKYYSKRFPDVKSMLLAILSGSGIVGLLLFVRLMSTVFSKIHSLAKADMNYRVFYPIMIVLLAGSFSINLIGYPSFWICLGFLRSK